MKQRSYSNEVLKFLLGKAVDGKTTTFNEIADTIIRPLQEMVLDPVPNQRGPDINDLIYRVLDAVTELCTTRGLPILTSLLDARSNSYPGQRFWTTIGLDIKEENKAEITKLLRRQCFDWFKGYTIGDTESKKVLLKKIRAIENYTDLNVDDDAINEYPAEPLIHEFNAFRRKLATANVKNPDIYLDLWINTYVSFSHTYCIENMDDPKPKDSECEISVCNYDTDRIVDFKSKYTYTRQVMVPTSFQNGLLQRAASKVFDGNYGPDAMITRLSVKSILCNDESYDVADTPERLNFVQDAEGFSNGSINLQTGPIRNSANSPDAILMSGNYLMGKDILKLCVINGNAVIDGMVILEVDVYLPPEDK